jgi:YVTN family beta-propeller protein
MAAVFLGAVHRPAPLIVYHAPAGVRPAGADALRPTDAILPNGRIAAPAGLSLFVGTNPLGMALTPDGRYAIVSNDDDRTAGLNVPAGLPAPAIGYSLAVVDTATMKIASVYRDGSPFFMGVAAVADPRDPGRTIVLASDPADGSVRVFDLDAQGTLTPEPRAIVLPPNAFGRAFPAGIAVPPKGRTAYVADNLGDTVSAIDLASRSVGQTFAVGDFPFAVAARDGRVVASASGLSSYHALAAPERNPRFAAPAFDAAASSTLTVGDLGADGHAADPVTVPMDPQPDGTDLIGGAMPGAIVLSRHARVAYVALSNVDRVAVVELDGRPHVARGLDLRLFPGAPFGAQPSGEALSPDGKRLYVSLAGLNSVAVLAALSPKRYRYGLIPTGWYPTSLAISPNGRYLFVLDTKGVDGWGMLQRVDLKHLPLMKTTLSALKYNRTPSIAKFNAVVPPLRSKKRSSAIDHVVYISVGTATYDAMLGDLHDASGAAHGNGSAALTVYPQRETPNLHALASTYALADNFYAPDPDLAAASAYGLTGQPSLFAELVAGVGELRTPFNGLGNDPDEYGRTGTLFNALLRAGLSFRDYGGLVQLSGYADGAYHLNVPALPGLADNTDLAYDSANPKAGSAQLAREFQTDMQRLVDAGDVPAFTYVAIPSDSAQGGVAGADRALGRIVDFLSHTPHWSSTAIFVVPQGVETGSDHVNPFRSYAVVVSPLAKRGYVGPMHLSVPSVLKTEEEILGLPALTLSDLLPTDMSAFFTDSPDPQPYRALP